MACLDILKIVLLLLLAAGCAVPSMEARRQYAVQAVGAAGWHIKTFETDRFDIVGFMPGTMPQENRTLTIYIEGDGLSWISRNRVSPDPTPVNPVGLKMALRHPDASVVYLSRPFQFGMKRNIDSRYWTTARFSSEVVVTYIQILDLLKTRFSSRSFRLVGYSGGGGLAAFVAAERKDVALLVTVAGNLDHDAWTRRHRISPLDESLNSADAWPHLIHIPQIHFYGEHDRNITRDIIWGFASRFPSDARPRVREVKDMTHGGNWESIWPQLYSEAVSLL
nr:hypothetical protein [uncultured Desulfobacter sp.]